MSRPDATQEHVVFRPSVEGLFVRELGENLDARTRAQLREVGLDLEHLGEVVDTRTFDAALGVLTRTVFAHLTEAQALRQLGRLQVRGFARSTPGWLVLHALSLLPKARMLERLTAAWRNANNFMETRVTAESQGSCSLWVNDVGAWPEFIAGILEESFDASGHPVKVELGAPDGLGYLYHLRF